MIVEKLICNNDESDSWISDSGDHPVFSSCSGPHLFLISLCCYYIHGFRQHEGLQDIYEYFTSLSLESYDFNSLLAEICNALEDVVFFFEEFSFQVTLCINNIVHFIYSVLCTLDSCSSFSLIDQMFDTDPLWDLRHHILMALRTIVGHYYPAVVSTVDFQNTPDPHNPVGPALSIEIYNYLTQSLCPMTEASTQTPVSSLEMVPANFKSQDWQRCQATMKWTQMSFQIQFEAPAPYVAGALLILTSVMTLVEQGCHHSVREGRPLFGGDGIWTHPLILTGNNWWCDR